MQCLACGMPDPKSTVTMTLSDFEKSQTWAEQIAALLVENAELRKARDAWRDAFTAQVDITNQLNEQLGNALRPKAVTPSFPLNAIKHSA